MTTMSSGNLAWPSSGMRRAHGTWDAAVLTCLTASGVSRQLPLLLPLRVTDTRPSTATTSTSWKPAMPPVRVRVTGNTAGWEGLDPDPVEAIEVPHPVMASAAVVQQMTRVRCRIVVFSMHVRRLAPAVGSIPWDVP
jgi:hypothetical protein